MKAELQALQAAVDSYMAAPTKMIVEVLTMEAATSNEAMMLMGTGKMISLGEPVYVIDATNQPNWKAQGLVFIWPISEGEDSTWSMLADRSSINNDLDFTNLDTYIQETEQTK